ncbi:osmoprotectant transport system permease protein [Curtobacterium sp. PhB142]|uniref:ABC transporter permease n=1 Tax=Curtobacterium citreum TaxID=2036 RepID=A0ABU8Y759_9MICO|nr:MULTISPECIES: ABC transporter permease [unclassified Curtobacterium]PZO59096.1 MAG: ABC transporter permease [Leifsonia xyli]ROR36765.1 osmoprotectant transport system permease protein [Curtobacterium sp. JUb34]ROS37327.1 osmoprotectant transport system permease protein [Curtobacterium sp. PhB78]TCL86116.1 osmoprotectant transport system permease protein [Curtobacterium sp. PhB142]TCM02306.1 osmoprotectant transport system permease protein [Curtobacterium sp. PhB134]
MSAVAAGPATGASTSWKGLLFQPIAILVVLAGFAIWLATADLTPTERTTLNPSDILALTGQHLVLTLQSTVLVLVIGIPLGIVLTRGPLRRASPYVLAVANFGQAAPAVGLIVLLAAWLGLNSWSAVVALVLYAILPVLRNTMIGVQSVDSRLVEAGRGMGMSAFSVLMRVELPLAVPVMLSGIRTALVLLVGTASLATFVGAGGLGLLITTGVTLFLPKVLVAGALLVALLALSIDWLGRVVETVARPKGLR